MTWSKRAVLSAALLISAAAPAVAQVAGRPFEISGGAGVLGFDHRAGIKSAPAYTLSLGWRLTPWISFEVPGVAAFSKASRFPDVKDDFTYYGGDFRLNLRTSDSRAVPYILTGVGYATDKSDALAPVKLNSTAGSLGLGLLLNFAGPRTYLRMQVRDIMMRDRTPDVVSHFAATVGLQYVLGGKFKDVDLDGVRDWLDQCPNTPIGAKVDAHGCPLDSDRDSVYDGLDACPNTPFGCKVDARGCPIDSDGDGVCDGMDQCADTPKGATVDAKGCPHDSDGDGVWDGIDQCPNTPTGAKVDARGCPIDSDKDGVPDGIDQCPNTPAGLQVDEKGCVLETVEREIELMDTGMIRLQNVNFETGKADILEPSKPALEVVGKVLSNWPTLQIEIGGHTDPRGGLKYNQKLSEARVVSVLNYLLATFPQLHKSQFKTKGYGYSRPIATNSTEAGMALNRRVEFVVLNKGELKKEIERRRPARKDEPAGGAPADTTRIVAPGSEGVAPGEPPPGGVVLPPGGESKPAPGGVVLPPAGGSAPADTTRKK